MSITILAASLFLSVPQASPVLDVVSAPQTAAPLCVEFCEQKQEVTWSL